MREGFGHWGPVSATPSRFGTCSFNPQDAHERKHTRDWHVVNRCSRHCRLMLLNPTHYRHAYYANGIEWIFGDIDPVDDFKRAALYDWVRETTKASIAKRFGDIDDVASLLNVQAREMDRGWVYVLEDIDGDFKIGKSIHAKGRCSDMNAGLKRPLRVRAVVRGYTDLERLLRELFLGEFKIYYGAGREWVSKKAFPKLVRYVAALGGVWSCQNKREADKLLKHAARDPIAATAGRALLDFKAARAPEVSNASRDALALATADMFDRALPTPKTECMVAS